MQLKSMTGYGKAVKEIPLKKIIVEVRSLNSKGMDLNVRMPYMFKEKELELRTDVGKQIERGKVDVSIYIESAENALPVALNRSLAKTYYNELKSFSTELNENSSDLLGLVLRMPDVMKAEKEQQEEFNEELWKQVKTAVDLAIADFQKFRMDEGKILNNEFDTRINIINNLLTSVVALDDDRIVNIKKRIKNNLDEIVDKDKIDSNRFEQELIYYVEKLDITEEKLRLKTHLDYFKKTKLEPSSGRKLGFISQEIGREVNTIGSKANDAGIQIIVVQMKDELEKIKEQLLNVL